MAFDDARFVAYSFPKIAIQSLRRGRETGMFELFTWTPVPEARRCRHVVPWRARALIQSMSSGTPPIS